jgi:hypothetical protein
MKVIMKCKCPDGPKDLVASLVNAYEVWWINPNSGELEGCSESGNDGWKDLRCGECDESLAVDPDDPGTDSNL